MGSLAGTLVVTLEHAVAAPFCTQKLADAGARVIKVERPDGGDFARQYGSSVRGQSAYFVWLNRGKESIALDIKQSDDRDLLERMIERADVFVHNISEEAARRAGLSGSQLTLRHPTLIYCQIAGYPPGPLALRRKAYDLLIQAESGLASITGRPEGPGRVGISVCDIAAGVEGYAAILGALIERTRTGRGTMLDISLFGVIMDWMTVPMLEQRYSGQTPQRLGLNHPSIAPYGSYSTADGDVVLAVQSEREWVRFCDAVLGDIGIASRPQFLNNERRVANRAALDELIRAHLSRMTRGETLARLARAELASASVNDLGEVWQHPSVTVGKAVTAGGEVLMPIPHDSRLESGMGAVPDLNEHGPTLRQEFAGSSPLT